MLRGETQYNPVSRFVREVPDELLDNKPPVFKKKVDFEEYRENPEGKSQIPDGSLWGQLRRRSPIRRLEAEGCGEAEADG